MNIRWREQTLAGGERRFWLEDMAERALEWVNRFLDQLRARGRSAATVRSYAMGLANFFLWWCRGGTDPHGAPAEPWGVVELRDYLAWQAQQQPPPAPTTRNLRLAAVRQLIEFHFALPAEPRLPRNGRFSHWGKRANAASLARVAAKIPHRQIVPLSVEEVARFWASFHCLRDLALVGLLLLNGLRAGEALALELDDVLLSQAEIRVRGKGSRVRLLPLAPETIRLLDHYLRLERPANASTRLFVCLKGRARGRAMTPAGLRSLFRHHRQATGVGKAHPHRFRHTFASDMIRAGVSLPALMRLMGHARVQTTMVNLELTPEDIYREYVRAVARRLQPPQIP
jgi:integrase